MNDISGGSTSLILAWKIAYLTELLQKLRPTGSVLQIGFEKGYGADIIQSFQPVSHTIVEEGVEEIKALRGWASAHKGITVIEGGWREKLPQLGTFSTIFFNGTFLQHDSFSLREHPSQKLVEASLRAKETKNLLEKVLIEGRRSISDQELELLFKEKKEQIAADPQGARVFVDFLRDTKMITSSQREKLFSILPPLSMEETLPDVVEFLKEAFKDHLQLSGKLSYFSNTSISNYEDRLFFDLFITEPTAEYREEIITIPVEGFSSRYRDDRGVIAIIEKVG